MNAESGQVYKQSVESMRVIRGQTFEGFVSVEEELKYNKNTFGNITNYALEAVKFKRMIRIKSYAQ